MPMSEPATGPERPLLGPQLERDLLRRLLELGEALELLVLDGFCAMSLVSSEDRRARIAVALHAGPELLVADRTRRRADGGHAPSRDRPPGAASGSP